MMNEILKSIINKSCHYTEASLTENIMLLMHPQSMSYMQSKKIFVQLFDNYQLKVSVKAFKYMGKDKTYAYARVQQESKKISGPEFKNNITDQLIVFKQDGDDWKIWTTAILDIKYLD